MKFKHALNVFIDNFAVTYKQLLYRLVITLISIGLCSAVIIPFINTLTASPDFISLTNGIKDFLRKLVDGKATELGEVSLQIKNAFESLIRLISDNSANIIWGCIAVFVIHLISQFFAGLGNYATAAVINDKMALRANSPFMVTLIHNLKEACIYSISYIPLSTAYDIIVYFGLYLLVFRLIALIPFFVLPLQLFVYMTAVVVLMSVKLLFTSDWLPSLIRGKTGNKNAFVYTFNRKNKNSWNVLSNFIVLVIIIFAINIVGIIFTFGVAALLTVPSSFIILLCFEFVNYYDREELKYFIDKNTIIKPEKEKPVSREEFFRGDR